MSKITLTAKEQKRKKEKQIKVTVALMIILLLTVLAIWYFVFYEPGNINAISGESRHNVIDWLNPSKNENDSGDDVVKNEDKNRYANVKKNPVVTMEMMSGEIIKIELYPKIAPTTVENFISLVKSEFYDGLTFHRLIPDFMAQGGDPSGDGTGGPGYSIYGEFSENGFENSLKHEIGVISMARANDPDSAGSQFFIVTNENSYLSLDGKYAGFGKVIEGMDTVYKIVNTETKRSDYSEELMNAINAAGGQITTEELYYKYMDETTEMSTPKNAPTIKRMTVETFGETYAEPTKIKE